VPTFRRINMQVGDTVGWKSQAGGYWKEKTGTIVAVVPAKRFANDFVPEGFKVDSSSLMYRDHESYLVQVGKSKKIVLAPCQWFEKAGS
jgi:hypothetical protein